MKKVNKRILRLTLNKKWFDLILSGKKKFEYREYKSHWTSRLLDDSGTRNFDEIHFTNGYGGDKPFMRVEFNGIGEMIGSYIEPENGEPIDRAKKYFVIALGEILEHGNIKQEKRMQVYSTDKELFNYESVEDALDMN